MTTCCPASLLHWLDVCLRAMKQVELVTDNMVGGAHCDELKGGLVPLFKTKKFLAVAGANTGLVARTVQEVVALASVCVAVCATCVANDVQSVHRLYAMVATLQMALSGLSESLLQLEEQHPCHDLLSSSLLFDSARRLDTLKDL
jgi:hypothetical protein